MFSGRFYGKRVSVRERNLKMLLETVNWPSGQGTWFLIQRSRVQNHWWFQGRLSLSSFRVRLVKWVPEVSGRLVVKSELPPRSGSSLEAVELHPLKGTIKIFYYYSWKSSINSKWNINRNSSRISIRTTGLSYLHKSSI